MPLLAGRICAPMVKKADDGNNARATTFDRDRIATTHTCSLAEKRDPSRSVGTTTTSPAWTCLSAAILLTLAATDFGFRPVPDSCALPTQQERRESGLHGVSGSRNRESQG